MLKCSFSCSCFWSEAAYLALQGEIFLILWFDRATATVRILFALIWPFPHLQCQYVPLRIFQVFTLSIEFSITTLISLNFLLYSFCSGVSLPHGGNLWGLYPWIWMWSLLWFKVNLHLLTPHTYIQEAKEGKGGVMDHPKQGKKEGSFEVLGLLGPVFHLPLTSSPGGVLPGRVDFINKFYRGILIISSHHLEVKRIL